MQETRNTKNSGKPNITPLAAEDPKQLVRYPRETMGDHATQRILDLEGNPPTPPTTRARVERVEGALERGDELGFALVHLSLEQRAGILEDRFDTGEDVEGVIGRARFQRRYRVHEKEGEHVVQVEVALEIGVDARVSGSTLRAALDLDPHGLKQ